MNCENRFCIYWKDNHCLLTHVSLDLTGACEMCIYVNIKESLLEEARLEILQKQGDDLFSDMKK